MPNVALPLSAAPVNAALPALPPAESPAPSEDGAFSRALADARQPRPPRDEPLREAEAARDDKPAPHKTARPAKPAAVRNGAARQASEGANGERADARAADGKTAAGLEPGAGPEAAPVDGAAEGAAGAASGADRDAAPASWLDWLRAAEPRVSPDKAAVGPGEGAEAPGGAPRADGPAGPGGVGPRALARTAAAQHGAPNPLDAMRAHLAAGTGAHAAHDAAADGAAALQAQEAAQATGAAPPMSQPLPSFAALPAAAASAQSAASSAAGAAAEARLAAHPQSADFAPQLGTQIVVFVREGVQHARLQLNPADLGPVQVRIALDGSAATVQMAADSPLTRQALEQAMPVLAGSLREAGLTLAGGGVFEQQRQPQRPGEALPRAADTADDAAERGEPPVGVMPVTARRRGVIDLVA